MKNGPDTGPFFCLLRRDQRRTAYCCVFFSPSFNTPVFGVALGQVMRCSTAQDILNRLVYAQYSHAFSAALSMNERAGHKVYLTAAEFESD